MRTFLGKKVFNLLAMTIFAGLALSVVEVGFSILIQSFLFSMNVIGSGAVSLPSWAPTGFKQSLTALGLFATARAALQWFKVYSHSMTNEAFGHHMKTEIANWALLSKESSTAQVITLLNDRVQSGANFITGFQNACIHFLSISLILFYLFKTAPLLALVGLGVLAGFGLILRTFDQRIKQAGQALSEASASINQRLLDGLKNLHFLKVCRAETRELLKVKQNLDHYFENAHVFNAIKSAKFASPQLIGVFVIILIAAYNRESRMLTGGAFVSFIYLFIRCSQTLSDISTAWATLRMYRPQFNDLLAWWTKQGQKASIEARELIAKTQQPRLEDDRQAQPAPTAWDARKIDFAYEGKPVLKGMDFQAAPGSITVVSGPSGAGKSTLLHVLSGLLPVNAGSIKVNKKYSDLDEAVRENQVRFGYVGPDPHVIHGTIRDNLFYGLDHVPSDRETLRALEIAHCTEFLTRFPEDLDRHISDRGDGLSTGQKQRLSLARALLSKPSALLLDEPTANLDSVSATTIVNALKNLRGNVTMVIITHNKSLVDIADQVIEF